MVLTLHWKSKLPVCQLTQLQDINQGIFETYVLNNDYSLCCIWLKNISCSVKNVIKFKSTPMWAY